MDDGQKKAKWGNMGGMGVIKGGAEKGVFFERWKNNNKR